MPRVSRSDLGDAINAQSLKDLESVGNVTKIAPLVPLQQRPQLGCSICSWEMSEWQPSPENQGLATASRNAAGASTSISRG